MTTPTDAVYLAALERLRQARSRPSTKEERDKAHRLYLATLRAMRDEHEGLRK